MASRSYILTLYKEMLRESQKFSGYNFRNYALRRVKDAFREGKCETDKEKVQGLVKKAEDNLSVIKRQALLSNMYKDKSLVIESAAK